MPTTSGTGRARISERRHRLAIKPLPTIDTGRFGRDDFTVDHAAHTSTRPPARRTHRGIDRVERCRVPSTLLQLPDPVTLHHRPRWPRPDVTDHDAELVEARAWRDGDFANDYRQLRPMVERSLAWLVRPGRRVAYRGLARNRIWLAHRAAAVNLQRLINLGLTHEGGWQLATR